MTEEQIERRCEREMNRLDRLFLSGSLQQDDYERLVRAMDEWSQRMYRAIRSEGVFS